MRLSHSATTLFSISIFVQFCAKLDHRTLIFFSPLIRQLIFKCSQLRPNNMDLVPEENTSPTKTRNASRSRSLDYVYYKYCGTSPFFRLFHFIRLLKCVPTSFRRDIFTHLHIHACTET